MTGDSAGPEPAEADEAAGRRQRSAVRERYGTIAATTDGGAETDTASDADDGGCCGSDGTEASSCCGDRTSDSHARTLGYDPAGLESVPDGANLGLGCGNPTALANLEPGETVVDLGAGGGFDCFLAARDVGPTGQVIGVDMTPAMVERARAAATRQDAANVEFRLGEIEHLPLPDESADVIISNCVVNLSPQKGRVFEEAFRVLRPGGRLAISDIVTTRAGREALDRSDLEDVARCIAGAEPADRMREFVEAAGFEAVSVRPKDDSDAIIESMFDDEDPREHLASAVIRGEKPTADGGTGPT